MLKIGITGQKGFIGTHLYNTLGLYPHLYERVEFEREMFESESALDHFVSQCDVIVHLAAMNRHMNEHVIYDTNIKLVKKFIAALDRTRSSAHVLFSSSSQEDREGLYGKSKSEGRELLAEWAKRSSGCFTGLIIPNVFGPFGLPEYNSFIATFCYRLTHGQMPDVRLDTRIKLIYVAELVQFILDRIDERKTNISCSVVCTEEIEVSSVLTLLKGYQKQYFVNGQIPEIKTSFEKNLFNTFRSYIDHGQHFPQKLVRHADQRGAFVEIIRLGVGGQVSFSTTAPGVTRGNHYHTRKIERFAVISGRALIQLRRVGTSKVLEFEVSGSEPAYVDMPIWYTHSIRNIGNDILYTNFWIDEFYNPLDADTFIEDV